MDIWVWALLGILYIFIQLLGKKKQRRAAGMPDRVMEDALWEMRAALGEDISHMEESAPAPQPIHIPAQAVAKPSAQVQQYLERMARLEDEPPEIASPPSIPELPVLVKSSSEMQSRVTRRLKDRAAAREAFVLSEVLGPPHALKRR